MSECPGYGRPLKWSTKHEVETQSCQGNSRIPPAVNTIEESDHTIAQFVITPPESASFLSGPLYLANQSVHSHGLEDPGVGHIHDGSNSSNQNRPDDSLEMIEMLSSNEPLNSGMKSPTGGLLDWSDLYMPLTLSLEDEDAGITRHYFSSVCRIQSCVDSSNNFFRVEIGNLMASCPLIYHCVLSMSAAHLATIRGDLVTAALQHRTKAMSCLKSEIIKMKNMNGLHHSTEALLGSILLGMTDVGSYSIVHFYTVLTISQGWHNSSFLGITHLHGARVLFKRWILGIDDGGDPSLPVACFSRARHMLVGIMAYWEAMSSFVMNQPLETISYLDGICDQDPTTMIQPTPWTGICTPLFVHMAKVGTLARQKLSIKNLSIVGKSEGIRNQLKADLLRSA